MAKNERRITIQKFGDFAKGEMSELLREGERGITKRGTMDGAEALAQRRRRRARGKKSAA